MPSRRDDLAEQSQVQKLTPWVQKLGFRNSETTIQQLLLADSETCFVRIRNYLFLLGSGTMAGSETGFVGFRHYVFRVQKLFLAGSETHFVGFRNYLCLVHATLDQFQFFFSISGFRNYGIRNYGFGREVGGFSDVRFDVLPKHRFVSTHGPRELPNLTPT